MAMALAQCPLIWLNGYPIDIVAKMYHSTGGVLGVLGMLGACCGPKFLLPT